ncbi:MAG TPA: histidine phosphatase family protein [Xanthobacteraceae bacterium]|nr:histidine phosphatase family protein [Xanthobacteraceae bacterium]
MPQPLLYFMRHGETDWNVERRLQGQHDIPLNAVGRSQALACGTIMRALLERDGRDPAAFDFVASPLGRARVTMELMRGALGVEPQRYRTDARLAELSFGRWEGFTFSELNATEADRRALATREHDKWAFRPPGGESYADLLVRVRHWHATVARDTVAVAHGGVARTLIVHFGIEPPAAAPVHDIEQGVVYEFAPGRLTRFA